MKKSFMEQMQKFHLEMQQEDLTIPDAVWQHIKAVKDTHETILSNAKETAHVYSFWCSDFFMSRPISKGIISYMVFSYFAAKYNKPITWFYMIPHQIVLDPAYQKVRIHNKPDWFNEDGSASLVVLAAFHEGKKKGLVDKDEEFVFDMSDDSKEFVAHTQDFINHFAEAEGISFDDAVKKLTGNEDYDMSFPHESDEDDDSL